MREHFSLRIVAPLMLVSAPIIASIAWAEPTRVTLPPDMDALTHYTTVTRGQVVEHMLITPGAIEAIRNGEPIPAGTHVVLADYRDDQIYRYFVMEKGEGWGADYDDDRRTDDWQFQWYWPDGSINMDENTARCQSCHQSREGNEYMFTFNDLRRFAQ